MAKNNKYASINFNHIYEKSVSSTSSTNKAKNPSPSPSPSYSSASYSAISAPNKPHGRILVLTRPTPKPVTPPPPSQPHHQHQQQQLPNPIQQVPDQSQSQTGSDAISLRPLVRAGTGSSLSSPVMNHDKDKDLPPAPQPPLMSPKPDKFVPPHLRPGFVRREEGPGPEAVRSRDAGHAGSPVRYGEDGRPKSGGYGRMRRGGVSDMGIMGRPRSSGSRPSSSGWYVLDFTLVSSIMLWINGGYEIEFFPEDEDKRILLHRWVLYANLLFVSFVRLELTSIFTRWYLKSLKTKSDQVAALQHLMSESVTKFVVLRMALTPKSF